MARPGPNRPQARGQLHVGRYLGGLLVVLLALYAAVAFAGPGGHWLKPKLGLDLAGGASVVLTPRTPAGQTAKPDQLATAVEIIQRRVNGLGVASAEVVTQGDNIVVSVPGGTRDSLKSLSSTAQLRFREVLRTLPGTPTVATTVRPTVTPSGRPTGTPKATTTITVPKSTASPKGRALSGALLAARPSPTPAAATPAAPSAVPSAAPSLGATPDRPVHSGDRYTPAAFAALDCSNPAARQGGSNDLPSEQIISCSTDGAVKYQLDVAKVVGTDVSGATAQLDQQTGSQWQVLVHFTGKGQNKFTNLTAATVHRQVAVVLDGLTISAPTIQERIDSDAQISGSFTQSSAQDLANTLKYGALPLSFDNSQVQIVSPTLGTDQLHSGLLAGGIGLIAVVIYSLLYYRALGLVTIGSLVVSGALTYACVTLLGKQIGFALSLAGIAGFIVAVGITADSFVVYFERIKDEIREGRTPRAAADRAWPRARRTILSADTVSFLAALILYFLSVGDVRGFAFTLGLSTLLDIVVVFFFTRPLVSWLARFGWFSSTRATGFTGPGGGPVPTGAAPTRRPLAGAATASAGTTVTPTGTTTAEA